MIITLDKSSLDYTVNIFSEVNYFVAFLHYFVLAKLATSSIRVNTYYLNQQFFLCNYSSDQ